RSSRYHVETLETAQQAVKLDPLDSRAQLALGWSLAFSGRWEQAELNFELALQLNSHDPWTMTSVGQAWAFAGRFQEALQLGAAALDATPLPNQTRWGFHAGIRLLCEDYEGALEAARTAGDSHANNGMWRAASLAHLGRMEEAREEAARCLATVARRWQGPRAPDPREATRWMLHLFPIRREADWTRLRDGLAEAGMPVSAAAFGDLLE
ncbi:MAG: trifolitoxin synthesis, TfuA, partial [Pseudomonadota bacterium]